MEYVFAFMAGVFIVLGIILLIVTATNIVRVGWTEQTICYVKSSAFMFITATILHVVAT